MAERPLVLRFAARSDVGLIRAKNDDSAYAGHYLAVVADGMGGHAGGDVASASTVLDLIHLDHTGYDGDAGTYLADEIQTANSLLSELVHVNPKLAGMGTTVTALLLSGDKLEMAHIGDSRAYRLKDGVFEQVSVDHTFVQRLIDEHRLRPDEAETHPHKNVLMRVLGDVDASPELDLKTFDAAPGERWLLCSDGLNYVRTSVVEDVVRHTADLDACADKLIELTLAAGSPDNVTVVVFEVAEATADDLKTAALRTVPPAAAASQDVERAVDGPTAAGASPSPDGAGTGAGGGTAASVPAADAAADTAAGASGAPPAGLTAEATTGNHEALGAHLAAAAIREELAARPHEMVGAAVTAAAEGKIPTIAGRSAARRAATVLTHKPLSVPSDAGTVADESVRPRSRRVFAAVTAAVVVAVLALGLVLAYAWTQTLYYVGESNGNVAIYNGVSQSLGPLQLSHVYRETDVKVSSLPEFSQQRVNQTVPANGLDDAQQIIDNLRLGSVEHPCPTASATPSASPSAKATATASHKATAPPSAHASASAHPTASARATSSAGASSGPNTGGAAVPSSPASSSAPVSCPGGGQ